MWPPPRYNIPMNAGHIPPHFPIPYHAHPHPPDPFIDRGGLIPPLWHQREPVENWRMSADDSWRSSLNHPSWSNHDIYQRRYAPLPIGRSFSQFARRPMSPPGRALPENTFDTPAQVDYEKQLRDQYEKPRAQYSDFSEAATTEKKIELKAESTAKRINLCWKLPHLPGNDDKFKINLLVRLEQLEGGIGRGARNGELGLILDKVLPIHISRSYFDAIPGSLYSIELNVVGQKGNIVASCRQNERATFSMDEMRVLMQKAIDFTGTQMQPFTYLYRCKPKIYWDYVYNETGQVLNIYPKDSNGQAASPINQNIQGLFFSARTNPDGSLPNSSPFGDVRMVLPAMSLLDPQNVNLYFSDFYCNRVPHYVTVVIVTKDSEYDRFCKEKLLSLNPFDNPFLLFQLSSDQRSPINFSVNKKVWVEIYYTENVPMRWGRFDNIIPQGAGTSKIGGLPHNKLCRTCNLYPVGASVLAPPDEFEPLSRERADAMVKEAIKADLVDGDFDDEDAVEVLEQQQASTSNFISYDVLKRRLERLEHALSGDFKNKKDGNEFCSEQKTILQNLSKEIGSFLSQMDIDFSSLRDRLMDLEKDKKSPKEKEEQQPAECPIHVTVNALIEEIVSNPEKKSLPRVRKLSVDLREASSSKRERRGDSL